MMGNTAAKLEQAKRRLRQRRDLERFEKGVMQEARLRAPLRLHALEKALAIQSRVYLRLHELREEGELVVQHGLSRNALEQAVRRLLTPLHNTTLLVFLCRWEHMGALELKGIELEHGLLGLLDFDGDTVTACDLELSRIVSFDRLVESDGHVLFEADSWSAT